MIISLRISKIKKIVLALSVLFFLSALPFSHKFLVENSSNKEPIFHGDTTKQRVAFGCNVFWGEEYIPKMLEVLESHNVHITFFIGGTWAKKNPDMLKLIASKGHEIANHSYSHPHPNNLNKEKNKEEIQKAEDIINEITQVKTKLYAPPYGEYNNTVITWLSANDVDSRYRRLEETSSFGYKESCNEKTLKWRINFNASYRTNCPGVAGAY